MVITTDDQGAPNVMPAGWFMFVSHKPPMLAVSVDHENYTHDLLCDSKEFVITYPSVEQAEAVAYCGTHTGANVNKFENTSLEMGSSTEVNIPIVMDSVACFECVKRGTLSAGDHTIFTGEIVAGHTSENHNEKLYTISKVDDLNDGTGIQSFQPVTVKNELNNGKDF